MKTIINKILFAIKLRFNETKEPIIIISLSILLTYLTSKYVFNIGFNPLLISLILSSFLGVLVAELIYLCLIQLFNIEENELNFWQKNLLNGFMYGLRFALIMIILINISNKTIILDIINLIPIK